MRNLFKRCFNDEPSPIYDKKTIVFTKEQLNFDRYVVKYESLDGLIFGHAGIKKIQLQYFTKKKIVKSGLTKTEKTILFI